MLVLSRGPDEGIRINDDIHIVVVELRGGRVRLGIEAPADTPVHRDEVYQEIKHRGDGRRLTARQAAKLLQENHQKRSVAGGRR